MQDSKAVSTRGRSTAIQSWSGRLKAYTVNHLQDDISHDMANTLEVVAWIAFTLLELKFQAGWNLSKDLLYVVYAGITIIIPDCIALQWK